MFKSVNIASIKIHFVLILVVSALVSCVNKKPVAVSAPIKTQNIPLLKDTANKAVDVDLALRLDSAINKSVAYFSKLPVDSFGQYPYIYMIVDVLNRHYDLKMKLPEYVEVEKKYPDMATKRLKLFNTYFNNNSTLPITEEELKKIKDDPYTALANDDIMVGWSIFCDQVALPGGYAKAITARLHKIADEKPMFNFASFAFATINFTENKCKADNKELDSLKSAVISALKPNSDEFLLALDTDDNFKDEKNLSDGLISTNFLAYLSSDYLLTYRMAYNLLNYQLEDGGWSTALKAVRSDYNASGLFLWLLLQVKEKQATLVK